MPLTNLRRKTTSFGRMFHKIGRSSSNLLVTHEGIELGLGFKRLMGCVKIKMVGGQEKITFSSRINPKHIGRGEHGTIFRLFPKEELQFLSPAAKRRHTRVPSVVLKAYHPDNPKLGKPDGFTQFFANTVVFDYLRKRARGLIVLPLHTLFVSERLLVREFINAPTIEEARAYLIGNFGRNVPLSEALSNEEIGHFLKMHRIELGELDSAEQILHDAVWEGAKANFGLPSRLKIEPDPIWRNVFVMGKTRANTLAFSVIDQGKTRIPGLGNMFRRGQISRQK